MDSGAFWELGWVTNRDLQAELGRLLASGSRTEARIIAHVAAVEDRRLHLEAGSSSLFDYCCRRLGLSENEAFHRIIASSIRKLPLPRAEAAARSLGLSRSVTSAKAPAIPETSARLDGNAANHASSAANEGGSASDLPARAQAASSSARKAIVEPLSAARYRIQLNASAELKQKLDHALDLLSHSNPSGDLSMVIERALDLLIERVEKERFAQTKSPRPNRVLLTDKNERSLKRRAFPGVGDHEARQAELRDHVSNDTKRQIAARDGLLCTFVGRDGQRCMARRFIQIHHEDPWACGGGETVDNLRILCASHSRLLAERDFGREQVAERIAASRACRPRVG